MVASASTIATAALTSSPHFMYSAAVLFVPMKLYNRDLPQYDLWVSNSYTLFNY